MPSDLRHSSSSQADSLPLSSLHTHQPEGPTPPRRRGITRLTVDVPTAAIPPSRTTTKPSKARWWTAEFIVYYVVAVIVIPWMAWVPVSLSRPSHPNYVVFQRRLSPGWLFGRSIDNSDSQYRSFRNNIPYLLILSSVFLILRNMYTYSRPHRPAHRLYLTPFLATFSTLMLLVLHGASAFKVIFILTLNYAIAKISGGSRAGPILTWVFNGLILFANERNAGYRYRDLHPALELLDNIPGIYPRWHIGFNITMLRLVSFNFDYHWACMHLPSAETPSSLTDKQRKTIPHALEDYSFVNYFSYALYPPLYIAGPIITYNDFLWQMHRPLVIPSRTVVGYLLRFLLCLTTMELILHFMYVVAIKDTRAWAYDSPAEIAMIGFWNLIIVWLKLLLPWRFFRLWSLADGVDPPENMLRCMANNYSTLGFWRSWHRSYNLWITRYIYIPMGGSKRVIVNSVVVFSFVALWHDLSFRLLAWGWLVVLFILPELGARWLLGGSKHEDRWWYRHVCALGAVGNILMMMVANLVGFVVGLDGIKDMASQLVNSWAGIRFILGACGCLFVGVQFMFEYREEEIRQHIYQRC